MLKTKASMGLVKCEFADFTEEIRFPEHLFRKNILKCIHKEIYYQCE